MTVAGRTRFLACQVLFLMATRVEGVRPSTSLSGGMRAVSCCHQVLKALGDGGSGKDWL